MIILLFVLREEKFVPEIVKFIPPLELKMDGIMLVMVGV
jgi:hypothetical protein